MYLDISSRRELSEEDLNNQSTVGCLHAVDLKLFKGVLLLAELVDKFTKLLAHLLSNFGCLSINITSINVT